MGLVQLVFVNSATRAARLMYVREKILPHWDERPLSGDTAKTTHRLYH